MNSNSVIAVPGMSTKKFDKVRLKIQKQNFSRKTIIRFGKPTPIYIETKISKTEEV